MRVQVSQGVKRIVRVTGEVDYSNVGELDSALDEVIGECPEGFVIDLSETTYMDSGGVQAILSAYVRVTGRGGRLSLVLQTPNIKEILALIHPEQFHGLHISDDIAFAERAIGECEGSNQA